MHLGMPHPDGRSHRTAPEPRADDLEHVEDTVTEVDAHLHRWLGASEALNSLPSVLLRVVLGHPETPP